MRILNKLVFVGILLCVFSCRSRAEDVLPPTHADAAIIFAKYSGFFEEYVSESAGLSECVRFFNRRGVYFGLSEVYGNSEFTVSDCARVMGQFDLIFTGDAEYSLGKVKLPKGIDSWESFCIINDVQYELGFRNVVQALKVLREIAE